MLAIVGCKCHNGVTMSQRVLHEAGVTNWLEVPSYRGREASLAFLDTLGDVKDMTGKLSLRSFLQNSGSYSVIIGYNDTRGVWVNVGRGDLRSRMDGVAIAKAFAE